MHLRSVQLLGTLPLARAPHRRQRVVLPRLQGVPCPRHFTSLMNQLCVETCARRKEDRYLPRSEDSHTATQTVQERGRMGAYLLTILRFAYVMTQSGRDKIDAPVEFPVTDLDLKPYVLASKEPGAPDLVYDLFAVSVRPCPRHLPS